VLAGWVGLPPVQTRSALLPLLIGVAAVAVGAFVVARGERRLGWGAIAAGILGAAGGLLATRSSTTHLDNVFVWSALVAAMLRYATPLTFAAIGGMFSERAGVINIGLEGMMLMGCFWGIWGADKLGSWVMGLVFAALAGGFLALIHAFFAIHLRADQVVGGTAVNFLALGITGYAFIDIYGSQGTPASISQIPDVHLGFLDGVYFVGPAFAQMNLMIWLMFALLVGSWIVMFRTPLGLRIRSVGEHPKAADTVGISVYGIRYACVVVSGMLAALGGAYLSVGFVHSFNQNMTVGRGFIALAALIFGKWRPFGAFFACLLFGFSSALAERLPEYSGSAATLFRALPYVLTLIAVAGVIGRSVGPAAVGRPYQKQ
jgi:simple sugar transport system permease protein